MAERGSFLKRVAGTAILASAVSTGMVRDIPHAYASPAEQGQVHYVTISNINEGGLSGTAVRGGLRLADNISHLPVELKPVITELKKQPFMELLQLDQNNWDNPIMAISLSNPQTTWQFAASRIAKQTINGQDIITFCYESNLKNGNSYEKHGGLADLTQDGNILTLTRVDRKHVPISTILRIELGGPFENNPIFKIFGNSGNEMSFASSELVQNLNRTIFYKGIQGKLPWLYDASING